MLGTGADITWFEVVDFTKLSQCIQGSRSTFKLQRCGAFPSSSPRAAMAISTAIVQIMENWAQWQRWPGLPDSLADVERICELLRPTSEMFGFNSSSSAYKPRTHCYHAMGTYGQHDCVFSVVLRFKIKEDVLDFARACGDFLGHKMCCDLGHISSDCDSLRNEVVEAFNEGRV